MDDDWDITDEEMDAWAAEWAEVDRAAADYLAERVPEVLDPVTDDETRGLDAVAETISPMDEPEDTESFSYVMALQHADWLGLALGVVRRGPGAELEPEEVQRDIDGLEDVEGEVEDPEGQLQVLAMALLTLTVPWRDVGVLDLDDRVTPYGVWALPRALHRIWTR